MGLVQQWERIQAELPSGWADARLALRLVEAGDLARAAGLLGPLAPGLSGRELRFAAVRHGTGPSPLAVGRALAHLDEEGIRGGLALVSTEAAAPAGRATARPALAQTWDALVEALPGDWSDLYLQIELTSTDHLEPAALALAPVNPARYDGTPGFRFRCARRFGYGASSGMVRRCLTRLDDRGIPGRLQILQALSDTQPVGTQGPVWHVGGKVV